MLTRRAHERRRASQAGLSIVEVMITLVIVGTVLAGVSGAFLANFSSMRTADGISSGTVFLETVMESLSAQDYADLPVFHGDRIFDAVDEEHSRFAVELTVFESEVDLLQIRAVLRDLDSGRELGRLTTFRSAR